MSCSDKVNLDVNIRDLDSAGPGARRIRPEQAFNPSSAISQAQASTTATLDAAPVHRVPGEMTITPHPLSASEFSACFSQPMRNVTAEADAIVDIWPYVAAVSLGNDGITDIGHVAHVYRDSEARFDQVLIETGTFNVFLVIVIDLKSRSIFGHRLLDLNAEYRPD
jgi:hypothetical protein